MIDLYYWPTPNGWKISIMLEECGLDYTTIPVNINIGDQHKPAFLEISPNNRMPAIIDHTPISGGEPISVFESGAILLYLAEKENKFLPSDVRGRYDVVQWLMWQMGGLGPMFGQHAHFKVYASEPVPYAIDRYERESRRLLSVLDKQVAKTGGWVVGAYSVADMAIFPWLVTMPARGLDLAEYTHASAWYARMNARPAVQKGLTHLETLRTTAAVTDKEARAVLFGIKP